jgi:hypothetical protein
MPKYAYPLATAAQNESSNIAHRPQKTETEKGKHKSECGDGENDVGFGFVESAADHEYIEGLSEQAKAENEKNSIDGLNQTDIGFELACVNRPGFGGHKSHNNI